MEEMSSSQTSISSYTSALMFPPMLLNDSWNLVEKKINVWVHFMFTMFKKKKKEKVEVSIDEELLEMVDVMRFDDDLEDILYDSSSKLYIINTYSINLDEIGVALYGVKIGKDISAINMYSFIGEDFSTVKPALGRIADNLAKKLPPPKVKHDIEELYKAYLYLK